MLTRDQKYAMDAHERVIQIKKKYKKDDTYKSYGAMSHKLPILIRTAGLAQALAFVASRGNEVQKHLLIDLAGTLELKDKDELLMKARTVEISGYMHLTQQVMAALLWYKRFAQSVLGVEAGDTIPEEEKTNG